MTVRGHKPDMSTAASHRAANRPTRRDVLKLAAAITPLPFAPAIAQTAPRVVVIGGGFGGTTCARFLKRFDPGFDVTLIEANETFVACPFSNSVIAGFRDIARQQFSYGGIAAAGVRVVKGMANAVDHAARTVALADGARLPYDRLVLAPGIDLRWDALPGYDEAASSRMPHAWKAGAQTLLLRKQLEEMEDGGLVVMSVPANPYRCPPGPYERASLIAHYLKTKKPRSKLLVVDAKDAFSKQRLFQNAWKELYPAHLEWIGLSNGGRTIAVDAGEMTIKTEFAAYKPAVANVIPPQRAGAIAITAGVADRTGWCPVDPVTFASRLQTGVHVIGDAAIMGAMPKSAFSANAQAKVCAEAITNELRGRPAQEPRLINTCYSLVAPDYGITVAGVYRPSNGQLTDVPNAGGTSPVEAPLSQRRMEADLAEGWFNTIGAEVFG